MYSMGLWEWLYMEHLTNFLSVKSNCPPQKGYLLWEAWNHHAEDKRHHIFSHREMLHPYASFFFLNNILRFLTALVALKLFLAAATTFYKPEIYTI